VLNFRFYFIRLENHFPKEYLKKNKKNVGKGKDKLIEGQYQLLKGQIL